MSAHGTTELIAEIQKAARHFRNGRRVDALLVYDEVAKRASDNVAVHVELGHLCSELGNRSQAVAHYKTAVAHEPDNAHYLAHLGIALQQMGHAEEAFEILTRAMAGNAEIPSVLHGLGIIFMDRADYSQARHYLEKAQQMTPGDGNIRTNLATVLARVNEHELALKHAEKGLKLNPANRNAHYAVGRVLTELGRGDEAIRHFEKTIRQHKTFGGAYDLLARMKKFSASDRPFIDKTEKVLQLGMPAKERACVHFALGKMYDDCGEWEKAFEHFGQGNLLQKKDYDMKRARQHFKQMKKVFNAQSLQEFQVLGHASAHPVFIVGMPRSGTTLMEHMIASHPRATGAGELPEIPRISRLISPEDGRHHSAAKARSMLTDENLTAYAVSYLDVLQQGANGADRIVDKLPGNVFYLGLISILFPNATIIHAIRHPLDTCLSCYFQNFTNVRWANDLAMIADIYDLYREVIAYWQGVLPKGKIVDVHYEQLIEDPEVHGRQMLEACGLDWDREYLEFYKKDKVVRTASLWQVRQPIYQSSKKRWKNYASHIGRLADSLSIYLQDDREELANHAIDLAAPSGMSWWNKLRN